ncbi:MFS transporter [Ensifer sp.]|jgi:MFS family permease|uniref:MFS transporter n=1 Tax=Ensifer sp. TaxID=1872086 RepID=UPI002E0DEE50|nr:MFS transporter [Ensifer sp.]
MSTWRNYAAVLRGPGVTRLAGATTISRLTTSMLSLSLLLSVSKGSGSFGAAGAVLFCHALSLAVAAPVGGRLADRYGPRRTLLIFIAVHTLSYAAIVSAIGLDLSLPALLVAAAVLGCSTPPSGAVVRGAWPQLVAPSNLSTAYALDTAINSSTFIVGPIVVGALLAFIPATTVLGLCAVAKITGDLLIATGPYGWKRPARRADKALTLMTNVPLLLLFAVIAADTFTIGALQVGAVASVAAATASLLLGAFAGGEVVGGLYYGARAGGAKVNRDLVALHLVTAVLFVAMIGVTVPFGLLALYMAAGFFSGARDAIGQLAVGLSASPELRTEAFGWLTSFMWAGYGLGTLLSGQLGEEWGRSSIYLCAAALSMAAATMTLWLPQISTAPSSGELADEPQ